MSAIDAVAGGDLAALRELHVQAPAPDDMFCAECGNGWPCRSARLLAAPASEATTEGERRKSVGLTCSGCAAPIVTVPDDDGRVMCPGCHTMHPATPREQGTAEAATEGEITSVEQLDELAVGTALRDHDGRLYERTRDDCGTWTGAYSRVGRDWPDVPTLPARLLSADAATPREQGTAEAATEGEEWHACPLDGEPLAVVDRHLGGPTFYRHADGSGHLDPTAALAATPRAEGEAAPGELHGLADRLDEIANDVEEQAPALCALGNRIRAHRCAAPAPEVASGGEAAAPVMVQAGTPKGVREALCVAQMVIGNVSERLVKRDQATRISEVLGALIRGIDVHRPIGVNGKHGDQHTATCGCDGHEAPWTITIAPPAPPPLAVGDRVETAADLDRLPVGTSVALADGDVGKRYAPGWAWISGPVTGYSFPARVLDLPEAAS